MLLDLEVGLDEVWEEMTWDIEIAFLMASGVFELLKLELKETLFLERVFLCFI